MRLHCFDLIVQDFINKLTLPKNRIYVFVQIFLTFTRIFSAAFTLSQIQSAGTYDLFHVKCLRKF